MKHSINRQTSNWVHQVSTPNNQPKTLPKSESIQNIYLRSKNIYAISPLQMKNRLLQKRPKRLFQKQNLKKYHMDNLDQSVKEIVTKTSYRKWRAPKNIRNDEEVDSSERLLPANRYDEFQEISLGKQLKIVDIASNSKGYGSFLKIEMPSKRSTSKQNLKSTTKSGLQKLTQKYHLLAKESQPKNKLAILPIKSQMFQSHFSNEQQGCKDLILERFQKTNKHFQSFIRQDSPELIRRIFQSLCNYSYFDMYAYIRYHVIFVTQEANSTQKCYFISNLFYQKLQSEISCEQLRRILKLICNNNELSNYNMERTVNTLTKIIFEGVFTEKLSKAMVFRKLQLDQNIASVMISLLSTQK